jgi:hypothetical protein
VVIEQQISQINNGGNRAIQFNIGDNVEAKDYRNNDTKWQKGKIIKCISNNTHNVELTDGNIWKRHDDQLLVDKSLTPSNNSVSLTPAMQTNKNSENTETIFANRNPDPTIINKSLRPIRSRKPSQRYSPSNYDLCLFIYG